MPLVAFDDPRIITTEERWKVGGDFIRDAQVFSPWTWWVPVHPSAHAALVEWFKAGSERIYGRAPAENDLIVPTRNFTTRPSPDAQRALLGDLKALSLRSRRGHDLRRTFITLAQVDGARRDILEAISHGPRGDIVSVYTTFPWPAMCEEIQKLRITWQPPSLPPPPPPARYTAVTGEENARNRWTKKATPAGFENFRGSASPDETPRSPREKPSLVPPSQALTGARGSTVARLAALAANAVRACDLVRALEVLDELQAECREPQGGVAASK
jgi:hypothetical protein